MKCPKCGLEGNHPRHFDCAGALKKRNQELEVEAGGLRAARIAYASEFDGDVGSIHENIRNLKNSFNRLSAWVHDLMEADKNDHSSTVAHMAEEGPNIPAFHAWVDEQKRRDDD